MNIAPYNTIFLNLIRFSSEAMHKIEKENFLDFHTLGKFSLFRIAVDRSKCNIFSMHSEWNQWINWTALKVNSRDFLHCNKFKFWKQLKD